MISPKHAQLMAAYNHWQNGSIYGAASGLSDAERRKDRGAFFKSIEGTLSHLLWADRLWLSRFAGSPPPQGVIKDSPAAFDDWDIMRAEREKTDAQFIAWTGAMSEADLEGDLVWRPAGLDMTMSMPRWILITHIFNHQTHHRGQAHAMLTAAGAKPADTDIPFLPDVLSFF
ncbi:MAG: DinB family protein [Parvularculaceae bacterium]